MQDLKDKTIRGGLARILSQGGIFFLRIGSMMVLGRLLEPKDFGLVGMVTAMVGVLNLFRDFGLSAATVQRAEVTEDQLSTLFWINILVGGVLGFVAAVCAPLIAQFYQEPRLLWVTIAMAMSFAFNAAGVQHSAILQRQMRFTTLAVIAVLSLLVSNAVGITMALRGFGYWSLVAMTVTMPVVSTLASWATTRWIPGWPRRNAGVRAMMQFGGTITLNGLIMYVAYNLEKVLLGRFWGADAIGFYGRAYQLITIPTDNLNSSIGEVAFSALSRLQDQPERLRSYFLKGYSLVLTLSIPISIVCFVFAEDVISVLLGSKWQAAAPIFRLLAPTTLVFAMINPFVWLLFSTGMVGRSLKIAFVLAPLVIAGYLLGLPYGPNGVALAYSVALLLWLVPDIIWCVRGTPISVKDVWLTAFRPLASGGAAALVAYTTQLLYRDVLSPLPRLVLGCLVLFGVYAAILWFVMGQKVFYMDLIRGMRRRSAVEARVVASA